MFTAKTIFIVLCILPCFWSHQEDSRCPIGFEIVQTLCVQFETYPATWKTAQHLCSNRRAYLAEIPDHSTQREIADQLFTRNQGFTGWIGGFRLNLMDDWIWGDSEIPVGSNTFWAHREPKNKSSNNCMLFDQAQGSKFAEWKTANCERYFPFICLKLPFKQYSGTDAKKNASAVPNSSDTSSKEDFPEFDDIEKEPAIPDAKDKPTNDSTSNDDFPEFDDIENEPAIPDAKDKPTNDTKKNKDANAEKNAPAIKETKSNKTSETADTPRKPSSSDPKRRASSV